MLLSMVYFVRVVIYNGCRESHRRSGDVSGQWLTLAYSDTRELLRDVGDLEERVYALEQRLSRVVGVRRVD